MGKKGDIVFLIAGMGICLLPFAGMTVCKTDVTTEKRSLAKMPDIINENGIETEYMQKMGKYFEDHFAFKNEMAGIDAKIMSDFFGTSSVDTVVKGTGGWLYYSSSLDDYLGRNVLTGRGAYNVAHNIKIMQDICRQSGADFLFTVAPNKNSLYGGQMPYYNNYKVSEESNISLVTPMLAEIDVNYVDLYEVFLSKQEILYRKQDSHWNQKGAILAYNSIMDRLDREHENYSGIDGVRCKTQPGDLAVALYSVFAEKDWDYEYSYEPGYDFVNDNESWEDELVQTENPNKFGTLLMFRDSFGNTLSPLLADEYKKAVFSKGSVYFMGYYLENYNPNMVIAEIVERNISHFGVFDRETQNVGGPPIIEGPVVDIPAFAENYKENHTTCEITESALDSDYVMIYGEIDEQYLHADSNIYVKMQGEETAVYEAYTLSRKVNGQWKDNQYLLYLKKDSYDEGSAVSVIAEHDGEYLILYK